MEEQVREHARQAMRREIDRRRSAGIPLFQPDQIGILHQQIRERRAATAAAT